MVRLTVVPVSPLALPDATKTATSAISPSVMTRRGWVVRPPAAQFASGPVSIPEGSAAWRGKKVTLEWSWWQPT